MKVDAAALLLFTAVFSVACGLALALRGPLRRRAGAGVAYAAWCLPPLMLLGLVLPAPAGLALPVPVMGAMPDVVLSVEADPAAGWRAMPWLVVAWAAGALACLGAQAWRQVRFMRALGPLQRVRHPCLPLFRATRDAGLPAVIGLWRPRIVLPPDFEQRYDATQRALLLRHEQVHRRRADLPCNALAVLLLCLQWFNPVAHLAFAAFRRDQEMACDARVLARRPRQRRAYAQAMLIGAGDALQAPLGCPWPSRHPLKERMEMLKLPLPGPRQRRAATLLVGLFALAGAYAAWATQPAVPTPAAPSPAAARPAAAKPAAALVPLNQVATNTLPPPRYPKEAYEKGLSGKVVLRVDVRADGSVAHVAVESSRPAGVFDTVTVEAAKQWRFRPEIKDGKPVAGRVRVPVTFELDPPGAADAPGGAALARR